jgi:hypothetical protein
MDATRHRSWSHIGVLRSRSGRARDGTAYDERVRGQRYHKLVHQAEPLMATRIKLIARAVILGTHSKALPASRVTL